MNQFDEYVLNDIRNEYMEKKLEDFEISYGSKFKIIQHIERDLQQPNKDKEIFEWIEDPQKVIQQAFKDMQDKFKDQIYEHVNKKLIHRNNNFKSKLVKVFEDI